jgi:hypothetical protein
MLLLLIKGATLGWVALVFFLGPFYFDKTITLAFPTRKRLSRKRTRTTTITTEMERNE